MYILNIYLILKSYYIQSTPITCYNKLLLFVLLDIVVVFVYIFLIYLFKQHYYNDLNNINTCLQKNNIDN